jgi:hypothetical protein
VLNGFTSVDDEAASPDDEDDFDFVEVSFSSSLFLSLHFFFELLHASHVLNYWFSFLISLNITSPLTTLQLEHFYLIP